jgi:hypothetical protein
LEQVLIVRIYEILIASGRKPPMARLTLARKIAAITSLVWKKGVCFDAKQLKQQAAGATGKNSTLRWIHVWWRSGDSSGVLVRG